MKVQSSNHFLRSHRCQQRLGVQTQALRLGRGQSESVCFTFHPMPLWCWSNSHGVYVRIRRQCLWDTSTIWTCTVQGMMGVTLSPSEHPKPMSPNLVTLKEETSTFIWLRSSWGHRPKGRTITTISGKDLEMCCWSLLQPVLNLIAQSLCCFLAWLDFMKLKYTQTKVAVGFSF